MRNLGPDDGDALVALEQTLYVTQAISGTEESVSLIACIKTNDKLHD